MSANESIIYDIEDEQRVFIVYFFMKAIVSTVTTEECETRQPSELGMCTTPSFLM